LEYPIFELPMLGGGMLIAGIAIFHVFIAQFSIGAAFLVALAERRAIRDGDADTRRFLRQYARMILLVPYVLGTMTGVGVWMAISVVNPRATSALIHLFVWAWASEWVLFIVEVASIYLYVYTWDRIAPRAHNAIAWIFAGASWLTLVIINGILSFMLTPGAWRPGEPGGFWPALLNPLFWPTTLIRTLIALALGGAGVMLLVALLKDLAPAVREKVTRLAYRMILPVWLCLPLAGWAFAVLPGRAQTFLQGGAPVMVVFLGFGMATFVILAASALVGMWRRDYSVSVFRAVLVCLLAFVSYGSFEFVREGARKPYIIEDFMYSTGVTVPGAAGVDRRANLTRVRADGVLAAAPWALPPGRTVADLDLRDAGPPVFRAACHACHTLDGYNAVRPLVRGWSAAHARYLLDHMNELKPAMPPFPGTDAEKEALARYLADLGTAVRIGGPR